MLCDVLLLQTLLVALVDVNDEGDDLQTAHNSIKQN